MPCHAAAVVTVRRALEAEVSELHVYFVRRFTEGGLLVGAFGVLPAALSFSGLADTMVWRLSSAAAARLFTIYLIVLFRRRRRVAHGTVPPSPVSISPSP